MRGVRREAAAEACLEALECRVLLCGEHEGLGGAVLAATAGQEESAPAPAPAPALVSWRKQAAALKAKSLGGGSAAQVGGGPLAPGPAPVGGGIGAAAQRLPDLTPWASEEMGFIHDWRLDTSEPSMPGRKLLRLSTAIANIGTGPLELRGVLPGNPDGTQDVLQRIYDTDGSFTDRLAGQFIYHSAHSHVHFEQFTEFRLRAVLPGDGVGAEVAASDKVSFCLLDVEQFDDALPGSPADMVYTSCGSVQGISVGWADVYEWNLDGQWVDVTDVPFGQYWLEVVTDPANRIQEVDETNNVTRIKINLNAPPTGDVGDTAAEAQSLGTIPVTIDGDIHAAEDQDWFSFAAAEGQALVFETVGNGDPAALEDTYLEVYGPGGTSRLKQDDDGGDGLFSKITWTAPASGVYYIVVSSSVGDVGSYRLSVGLAVAPPPDDHGNIPPAATTVGAPTATPVAGVIEQLGDADWFRFTASEGVSYIFETHLGTLEDSVLSLYGPNGTTLLEYDDDGGSELRSSRIEWTATVSGTYYLEVGAYADDSIGSYTLTIEDDQPVPDDHGNSAASATPVAVNSRTAGNVGMSGDVDWFRFAAVAGTDYNFTTVLGTLDDSVLRLIAPDGTSQVLSNDDGAGQDASRILWTAVVSGVYYLEVSGAGGDRGTYELLVMNDALPPGWQTQLVGQPATPGWANHAGGVFTVQGGGADIGGSADAFQFVYQQMVGDGEIVARVADLHETSFDAKAGVMIRAGLEAGAAHAMAMLMSGGGAAMQHRQLPGTPATTGTFEPVGAPVWLKLVRLGGTFMAYWSADGQGWNLMGQANVPMPPAVYIGLAVTSAEASALSTSRFDGVEVDSMTPAPPTGLAAGPFGTGRVRVTWQTPQGTIDGFEVQRSINGGPWEVVATPATHGPTAQSYTDGPPVSAATEYAYRVRAVRGQNFSAFSEVVSYTTAAQDVAGTAGADTFRLRLSDNGQNVEVYVNVAAGGQPTLVVPRASLSPLSISGGLGNDTLEVDFGNGDPLPDFGVDFDGGGDSDTVVVRAGASALDLSVSDNQIGLNPLDTASVRPFDVETVRFDGGAGNDVLRQVSQPPGAVTFNPGPGSNRLVVEEGTFRLSADVPGLAVEVMDGAVAEFAATHHLSSLTLNGTGRAAMVPMLAGGERVLRLGALTMDNTARLDLGTHGLIIDGGNTALLDMVLGRIASARGGGAWNGAGITSSALTANGIRGLAAALNGESGGLLHGTFRGEAVDGSAVLVLYTFNGDSNLDGRVNISDFFRIDVGRAMRQTRYANGDFNFSGGVANADDYVLIDRAFLGQGQGAAAVPPAAAAPAPLAAAFSAEPVAADDADDEEDLFGGQAAVL